VETSHTKCQQQKNKKKLLENSEDYFQATFYVPVGFMRIVLRENPNFILFKNNLLVIQNMMFFALKRSRKFYYRSQYEANNWQINWII
jgi:hypothetical protein